MIAIILSMISFTTFASPTQGVAHFDSLRNSKDSAQNLLTRTLQHLAQDPAHPESICFDVGRLETSLYELSQFPGLEKSTSDQLQTQMQLLDNACKNPKTVSTGTLRPLFSKIYVEILNAQTTTNEKRPSISARVRNFSEELRNWLDLVLSASSNTVDTAKCAQLGKVDLKARLTFRRFELGVEKTATIQSKLQDLKNSCENLKKDDSKTSLQELVKILDTETTRIAKRTKRDRDLDAFREATLMIQIMSGNANPAPKVAEQKIKTVPENFDDTNSVNTTGTQGTVASPQ